MDWLRMQTVWVQMLTSLMPTLIVSCLTSLLPWPVSIFAGHCESSLKVLHGFTVNSKCNLPSTSVGFTVLDSTGGWGLKILFKSYGFYTCPLSSKYHSITMITKLVLDEINLDMI